MIEKKNIMFKLTIIYILMIIFGLMVIGKITYLHFFYDKDEIANTLKLTRRIAEIEPNRGDIYSSDGKLLATSVPYFELGIDPNCDGLTQEVFENNIDSLSYYLSTIFTNKSQEQFREELIAKRDDGSRYYRFCNRSYNNFEELKRIRNFPILRLGRFRGGFVHRKINRREYPFGNLARRTIGTASSENRAGVGLEDAFNDELKGTKGYNVVQRIANRMWMPVSDFNHVEPKDGYDLITTIDIKIQDIAETALKNQLLHHDASFGTVVVMEVSTGKVRGIVNLTKNNAGNYVEHVYNYAVGRSVDPGSTFKLASVIAVLEDGYIEPDDLIETGNGKIRFFNHNIEDILKGGYGTISLKRVFEVSSNVGISKVINQHYKNSPEKFIDRLYKMELNKPLGVVIKGEPTPNIPYPGHHLWSGISIPQISIGYEVQLTPLQILAFYNAIANDGCMLKPIFAEELRYRGKTVRSYGPEIINSRICSKQTLAKVREMLIGVVENGTARNIRNNNFKIAGKTGTAQINYGRDKDDEDSKKIEFLSSFVGFFPADDPKYSIIVSIYEPQINGIYGSIVAAPVFKEIAEKIYAFYPDFYINGLDIEQKQSIPIARKSYRNDLDKVYDWFNISTNIKRITNSEWVKFDNANDNINYSSLHFSDNTIIPNVLGMNVKDALIILEQRGFEVVVKGRGKVVRQTPRPGTKIKNQRKIEIFLDV